MSKLVINIPQDWTEINIGQYIEFDTLDKTNLSNLELMVNLISIFCNVDPEEVEKLTINQINDIAENFTWVNLKPMKNFYQTWEHNGIKYGFHPNLNSIKVGEWIDLELYMKNPIQNLHKLLSVLYRPITKINNGVNEYEIEDYDSKTAKSRAELFYDNMPIDLGYGTALFFLSFAEELLATTAEYSIQEAQKILKETTTKD